jgi:hypothetical protein
MLRYCVARDRELSDDCSILTGKLGNMTFCSKFLQICRNQHSMPATGKVDLVQMSRQPRIGC